MPVMMRILLFCFVGCGGVEPREPVASGESTTLVEASETVVSAGGEESMFTPGQQASRAEGRFAAQDDLAQGIVRVVDFDVDPATDVMDERTGLPLGAMADVDTLDPTAWRDAYNDTMLDSFASSPPFPEDLRLLYTLTSRPDGVRHYQVEVTADAVSRQRDGLDSPVEISMAERYRLGILARRARVTVTGQRVGPGLWVEFVAEQGEDIWSFTTEYPAERIGSSSALGELLETIAQR